MKKTFKSVYIALILLFLYAPIAVMIALSFNASKSRAVWGGFSLTWYAQLFDSPEIMQALQVTLTVALLATLVATVIGSLGAIGIHAMKTGRANALINLSYLSMTTPDIATGVSLMLMFVFMKIPLGWGTYEAALDLGCKPGKALRKVILPQIMPGIVTGALLSFTMSLDDFVISYFTSNTDQNLSMIVYSAARRGIEPTIYALSTLMFLAVLVLLVVINKRSSLEDVS